MTAWRLTESLDKPETLTLDGNNYMQTRNVKKIKETTNDAGEKVAEHYEYELRWMSVSEYEMLSAMQNIYSGGTEV